jgi:outer membrane protein OmpA-like peptidoglycan-associated protein/tetratricopeptide (TPR) repeat protein
MSKAMRKYYLTLLALIVSLGFGYSQTNRSLIRSGDKEMEMENYASAVYFYSQVINRLAGGNEDLMYNPYSVNAFYKSNPKGGPKSFEPPVDPKTDDELIVLHKLSDAYRLVNDYENAEKWYAIAVEHPKEEFPYARYFYGYSLMKNAKYEEAKKQFEIMMDKLDESNLFYEMSREKTGNCDFALGDEENMTNATVEILDSIINNGTTSFGMMYHRNGLLFSSARKDTTAPEDYKHANDIYNSDVFLTERSEDGSFSTPEWFEGNVNSPAIEGGASLSPDGKAMYFTKVNPLNHQETGIYVTRYFNGRWTEPFKLGDDINKDGFKSMTPSLADDGETLYYASNRPGGIGGMDLWMTTINTDGETTEPVNLGDLVNTKEDEITPFYHPSSKTLYFSSEGHIGFGGQDVFKTTINPVTEWWSAPENIGKPVNSERDDAYFIWGAAMQEGYFSSDRDNCGECDSLRTLNMHCNSIYRIERPAIEITISGYIFDFDTDEPVPNASVNFKDVRGTLETVILESDEEGYYERTLRVNEEYFIKATKKKYFADANIKNTLGIVETTNITQDFYLTKIPTGEIEIKGIEYDFDAATLRESSRKELDKLVEFLELNSNLKIEIRSHTDERGRDSYNLDLSERRAQSVVDYLVDNGISRSRLNPSGLGETEPAVVTNDEGEEIELTPSYINGLVDEEKQEEYHQRNRRTAFKVLAE